MAETDFESPPAQPTQPTAPTAAPAAPRGLALAALWLAPIAGAAWLGLGASAALSDPLAAPSAAPSAAAIARWAGAASYAASAGAVTATLALFGATRGRASRAGLGAWLAVVALPLALMLLSWALDGGWFGRLPAPGAAGTALAALVTCGAAFGSRDLGAGLARAAGFLLLATLLDGAPQGWGVLGPAPPWSAEAAARWLDASPRALVLETGGVDWMRHSSVYEPVGTDRIGPGIRIGRSGSVAAIVLLVVGCAASSLVLRSAVAVRRA